MILPLICGWVHMGRGLSRVAGGRGGGSAWTWQGLHKLAWVHLSGRVCADASGQESARWREKPPPACCHGYFASPLPHTPTHARAAA
eukprot:352516-Chlamydomonas_euryale.AAC.1